MRVSILTFVLGVPALASALQRVESAWCRASTAGAVLVVVDAARQLERPDPRVVRLLGELVPRLAAATRARAVTPVEAVDSARAPAQLFALLLNKCDKVRREDRHLLPRLAENLASLHAFDRVLTISGLHNQGVDSLRSWLADRAPPADWAMAPDAATDLSAPERIAEAVREQIFNRLNQELPYVVVSGDIDNLKLKSLCRHSTHDHIPGPSLSSGFEFCLLTDSLSRSTASS